MLSGQLKVLREARSWSQSHLAYAAGLNIRTVQRIEAGEPASSETLLSLAAALNVDIGELDGDPHSRQEARGLSPKRATLALVLMAPAAVFITVNLLRGAIRISGPYDALARTGSRLMDFQTFNVVSPAIFLGGPALAFILCLPALVTLRTSRPSQGTLNVSGLELRASPAAIIFAVTALLSAGTLVGYAALEFLRSQTS